MEKLRENKGYKIVKKIIEVILVIVVILFIGMVCLQRFSNNRISFMNYRMFSVISGSMEPKYKIGDVLISKEVEPSKIKKGDTISYLGKSGGFENMVITHMVTDVVKSNENGKYYFHSKGLANIVEDPIVSEDQLYGVVTYKVKSLSVIYKVVGTKYGMIICVILPLFYIIGSEMLAMMLAKKEKIMNHEQ